jgi:hypothetical protein
MVSMTSVSPFSYGPPILRTRTVLTSSNVGTVQIDVPDLGAALVDHDDFVLFSAVEIERLDQRIGVEAGHAHGQQRSRARNGTLPAITSSFAFFIEGLQPILCQDGIGPGSAIAIGSTVGRKLWGM